MSLLKKKIKDLTPEDHDALYVAVGTPELPYPATHFVNDKNGMLSLEIGTIADRKRPLTIYADRDPAHVVGLLYRKMAIPSLLHAQKEAILRRAPDSNNRLMAIFGDPGSGKSHMAKLMARMRDTREAEVIDCGGRYMGDLLFEQVIDFGEDFKTALTTRIRSGLLSEKSIKIFDEEFPHALIKDSDNKVININWDAMTEPKNRGTKEKPEYESSEETVTRVMNILENTIAKWESIPSQTVNTVGIRKQPGPLIRAFEEGRELILDEYTKKIEGSDDSLQTVLQFLTGEIPDAVVENSMKINGREETYSYTFRREDLKPGFFVTMTGNKQSDGISTHALSRSAYSRISPFPIENPLPIDWKHRISQILTGVPLTTLYGVFDRLAFEDPQGFEDMLIEIREMGLSEEDVAKIPQHQTMLLRNWRQTMAAIDKLAHFYMFWSKMVDPSNQNNGQNIDNVLPEVSASYRDEMALDFRKVIQDITEALTTKPQVRPLDKSTSLRLRFNEAVHKRPQLDMKREDNDLVVSELGDRLEAVLKERIGISTMGRPNLQRALLKEAHQRSLLSLDVAITDGNDDSTADDLDEKPKTLRDLLNQDQYSGLGGIEQITSLRKMMIAAASKHHPADDGVFAYCDVITTTVAAEASAKLMHIIDVNDHMTTPASAPLVLVGDGLEDAFEMGAVLDSMSEIEFDQDAPAPEDMISTSEFLESLFHAPMASMNLKNIWRNTATQESLIPETDEDDDILKSAIAMTENKSSSKIAVTSLMAKGQNGEATPIHVLRDGERRKTMIVADHAPAEVKAQLDERFTLISYNDPAAEENVRHFIRDTLEHESRADDAPALEKTLTYAFLLRAGKEDEIQNLATMITNKHLEIEVPLYLFKRPELKF